MHEMSKYISGKNISKCHLLFFFPSMLSIKAVESFILLFCQCYNQIIVNETIVK